MTEQSHKESTTTARKGETNEQDSTRDNQDNELEAEQESAAAMDADVPQPPDASETTEGQPS
jgi:hypothetical protein